MCQTLCLVHFDLEMNFAPQRRAMFRLSILSEVEPMTSHLLSACCTNWAKWTLSLRCKRSISTFRTYHKRRLCQTMAQIGTTFMDASSSPIAELLLEARNRTDMARAWIFPSLLQKIGALKRTMATCFLQIVHIICWNQSQLSSVARANGSNPNSAPIFFFNMGA